jgi:hypothetical protein
VNASLAAALVRSLFCGLPRQERRVAVFTAFADETDCGVHHEGTFFYCGFLAPEQDWANIFVPLWDARVLKGPPRITEFHATELKNKYGCQKYGIDLGEADFRIGEAFGVISAIPSLAPVCCELNGGHLRKIFERKVKFSTGAMRPFEPDYLAFYGFVFGVLGRLKHFHPEAEKVDFVVERKNGITNRLQEFHAKMPRVLRELGLPDLADLLGEVIPGGKDRFPLHAADLICWYTRRSHENNLEMKDMQRYSVIGKRKGVRIDLSDDELEKLYSAMIEGPDDQGI